jgi:DNA transformation protein and related proteins
MTSTPCDTEKSLQQCRIDEQQGAGALMDNAAAFEDQRAMVASDSFAEFLREQLAPLGRVSMRRMFGKTGVFCDGVMFGIVTEDTLYLRVDDHNRATFKEAAAFPPLNYQKKGNTIDLAFWRVPERLIDEPDELVGWARAALAAARRIAAKRPAPRSAPGRKSKL